jgi:hypothetical protein
MDESTIVLTDETGRALPCYLEKKISLNGKDYILLNPVDYPVQVFAWESEDEESGMLAEVEEAEIDQIFDTAQAVLAEMNLVLKRTAYTLTVEGEMPEVDEDDIIQIDGDEEDEEGEEFVEIAHFYHEEKEYSVFAEVDPLPYFAKEVHSGEMKLLSPDELSEIQPYLEEQLAEDDDEEEEF